MTNQHDGDGDANPPDPERDELSLGRLHAALLRIVSTETGAVDTALPGISVCDICSRQAGRHHHTCARFVVTDNADLISAQLEVEEEIRERYSEAGILDMVRREFYARCKGGRVELNGFLSFSQSSFVFDFDDPRGNRCRFELTSGAVSYDREKEWKLARTALRRLQIGSRWPIPPETAPPSIRDAVREVTSLLASAPCPHQRKTRRHVPSTNLAGPFDSAAVSEVCATIETVCLDCGKQV